MSKFDDELDILIEQANKLFPVVKKGYIEYLYGLETTDEGFIAVNKMSHNEHLEHLMLTWFVMGAEFGFGYSKG